MHHSWPPVRLLPDQLIQILLDRVEQRLQAFRVEGRLLRQGGSQGLLQKGGSSWLLRDGGPGRLVGMQIVFDKRAVQDILAPAHQPEDRPIGYRQKNDAENTELKHQSHPKKNQYPRESRLGSSKASALQAYTDPPGRVRLSWKVGSRRTVIGCT